VVVAAPWVVVDGSTVVVVGSTVVVVGSTVVVVGSTVVVVGSTVVVVGSTVLTGAGCGSVAMGAGGFGGSAAAGRRVVRVVAAGAVVGGPWEAGATGATPGGDVGALVDDIRPVELAGATVGGGPVVDGWPLVSPGRAETTGGTGGPSGTRAADATSAASTAKVRPNATSMRRRCSRCSARWRGFRCGKGHCQFGLLSQRRPILRIVGPVGKSPWAYRLRSQNLKNGAIRPRRRSDAGHDGARRASGERWAADSGTPSTVQMVAERGMADVDRCREAACRTGSR
jgi:hypothetical protein